MSDIIPINPEIEKMSDSELLRNFHQPKPPYGKMNYYAVFAKRSSNFKDLLKEEVLNNDNNLQSVMGIIKVSWLPLISILCYAKDEQTKKAFINLAKEFWAESNFEDFKNYLLKDEQLSKYIK